MRLNSLALMAVLAPILTFAQDYGPPKGTLVIQGVLLLSDYVLLTAQRLCHPLALRIRTEAGQKQPGDVALKGQDLGSKLHLNDLLNLKTTPREVVFKPITLEPVHRVGLGRPVRRDPDVAFSP